MRFPGIAGGALEWRDRREQPAAGERVPSDLATLRSASFTCVLNSLQQTGASADLMQPLTAFETWEKVASAAVAGYDRTPRVQGERRLIKDTNHCLQRLEGDYLVRFMVENIRCRVRSLTPNGVGPNHVPDNGKAKPRACCGQGGLPQAQGGSDQYHASQDKCDAEANDAEA